METNNNQTMSKKMTGIAAYISYVGHIFSVFALILWCIGLSYAIKEEDKELPIVGSIKLLGE